MTICIVTSNKNKASEVAEFFRGITEIEFVPMECPEYRSSSIEEIARKKAEYAYQVIKRPLIADDTGFFISALSGFPGPYAAYVLDTIGNAGILQLMEDKEDRYGQFITVIAYADQDQVRTFSGTLEGEIVSPRGSGGFGYDPIFFVKSRTLAELTIQEKSRISHRGKALTAFRNWYEHEYPIPSDTNVKSRHSI